MWPAGDLTETFTQLSWGNVEAVGDRVHIGLDVLHPVAHDEGRKRWIVIDDLAAFAIEDLAARSRTSTSRMLLPSACAEYFSLPLTCKRHNPTQRTKNIATIAYCAMDSLDGGIFSSRPNI